MNQDQQQLQNRVESALESIRPFLQTDGGNVELVEITTDMHAKIRLLGACQTCSMSAMTMKSGIEKAIMRYVPEILAVEAIA